MSEEPIDRFVERLLAGGPVSRRVMLQRLSAAGLVVGSGSLLAACGGVEGTDDEEPAAAPKPAEVNHPKTAIGTLVFSNWPLYIDKKVLKDFEKRYDANVKYTEDINDNEEFFAKVRQELEADRPIGRDLVALTDWMAQRWIESGYTEPLDKKNIPNAANLVDNLQDIPWDKGRKNSLPWQSGMSAIGYNPKKTGRKLTSVNDLFDPKFKGRVSMLGDWHDSAGLVVLSMGKKTADATKDDVLAAIDKIDEENRKGQIRRFTGNDYAKDLASGNLWACVAYSGDVIQLQADNPELEFLIPEEGAVQWSDNMMIPKGATSPYGAETMMNFVYDPEVAAKLAAYVNYVTPVKGAQDVLAETDPELAENELIFPSDETRAKLNPYVPLNQADDRAVTARMQEVTGA